MTYTYDPSAIRARGKDQMRFELGDTQVEGGADTCVLADEEYEAFLSEIKPGKVAWLRAKLSVVEAILFKLSYQVDTKIDVLSYDFGERADRWKKLYDDLKKQVQAVSSVPTMSPDAYSDSPYFRKGMLGNVAAGSPDAGHICPVSRPGTLSSAPGSNTAEKRPCGPFRKMTT